MRHRIRTGETPSVKFDWFDLVVVATTTLQRFAVVVEEGLDVIDDMARAHANYRRQRSEWAAQTIKEIESL